jgi:hypothetical protein
MTLHRRTRPRRLRRRNGKAAIGVALLMSRSTLYRELRKHREGAAAQPVVQEG